MSVDSERLVLSEVHIGNSTLDEEEVVSRYTYLTPQPPRRRDTNTGTPAAQDRDARPDDGGSSDNDDSSSSSGGESEEGGYSRVTRHRKRLRTSSRRRLPAHEVLTVVHRMATTLGLVGQQVWSAAFLLGDFVLTHQDIFAGMQVLELGAGPGVVGLVAARVAKRCYLTDYHQEVLKLLARNAEANRHLFATEGSPATANGSSTSADSSRSGALSDRERDGDTSCGGGESGCVVAVRELDWFTFSRGEGSAVAADCDPPEEHQDWHGHSEEEDCCAGASSGELNGGGNGNGPCRLFSWRKHELEGLPASTSHGGGELVLVAADVIYDEGLTDAFFHALRMLMPIPASPMPPVRKNEHELAGDHGKDAASPPRDCVTLVDQTPSNPSANTKSVGAEAAAAHSSGDVSTSKEHVVFGAEGGQGQAVLYLALEKRFNFSMAELSVAATGYSALLRNVLDTTPEAHSGGARVDGRKQQGRNAQKDFEGRRLPLSFQQCFHYRRNDAMELWEIRRRPRVGLET